ncbi:hypothetical protein FPV67DRAFT_1692449 [Lyophyllum atratum]|nr:hypothetical protein FPV67DRAFT_1692449 [Lyophyllum atratum]
MSKQRRTQIDSDSYIPPRRGEVPAPVPITQCHTNYEITDNRLVASHSYITVPGLPAETPSSNQFPFDESPSTTFNDGQDGSSFSFDWMDPSYLPDQSDQPELDNPLMLWEGHIDEYLQELLCLEGPGGPQPLYRCFECVDTRFFCSKCIVEEHRTRPLHHVKVGHPAGERCINPLAAAEDGFVVVHTNGIHTIGLNYCNCLNHPARNIQLLRSRFYPATTIFPKTAATFEVLETFQLLSFMSKASAFEFYQTLVRRTDNTGTTKAPDRYAAFLRMVREWCHLKLLKRAGCGNDPAGVKATREGECAVLCPACQLPGMNLPNAWKEAPDHQRWLYALFLGIDANFHLKRLKVSSTEHDPGLNHGYAYFVDHSKFKAYLHHYGPLIPDDVSTCSNHDAIKSASIRRGKGVDASGVGKAECAHHNMKRPVSVGDLQKGERYVNMDFFFLSSLTQNAPQQIVVSYDIACQWGRNLKSRCKIYPSNPYGDLKFIHLVPKFHLRAHRPECHVNYSFNLTPHVGRTDGKAPERGWAAVNAVATSTKEMGPGSRCDTLDDHFASTLLRKITEATTKRAEQVTAFELFDTALPAEETSAWTRMVQAWEADGRKANPYATTIQKITETAVCLELAAEEEAALREDLTSEIHDDVKPSRLIAQGLEIEDHQRILLIDSKALGPHATDLQRSKVIERCTRLWHKIKAWTSIQQLYIPGLASIHARAEREGGDEPVSAVNIDLLLPSKLAIPCDINAGAQKYKNVLIPYSDIHLYSFVALRIEWCRARARAHCWQEECLLLEEEMRRVVAFFEYEERRWHDRSEVSYPDGMEDQTVMGMRAYCHHQAAVRRSLIDTCHESWKGVPRRRRWRQKEKKEAKKAQSKAEKEAEKVRLKVEQDTAQARLKAEKVAEKARLKAQKEAEKEAIN